ncbi:unnamed protein product [Mycena citricolor]|uniref:DNA polymerase epsilon subunit D n=1 Tax=Mycena citricolor TaxID=2018698 RepID=A0AAD2HLN9_9AGAR|nr:unnamed protein product [Mycena citricolor]
MPRKDAPASGLISAQAQQDLISEGIENYELPKSLVTRIAKSALPDNAKMQKDTVLSLVKGSTVFINYLVTLRCYPTRNNLILLLRAHDVALSKQHKSISASDVLKALEMIEFGDLVDMLQAELQIYRDQSKSDKTKKASASANLASASTAAAVGKGKSTSASTASTPAPKSAKGKEKATILLPASALASARQSESRGAVPVTPGESVSAGPGVAMDVDGEDDRDVDIPVPADSDREGDAEIEEADEEQDVEEEEPEEVVDTVALEQEELRQDARGLDARAEDTAMEE